METTETTTTVTTKQEGCISAHLVRTGCEWCRVLIDPTENLVLCYGPTGNYNFSWYAPGEEFIKFLVSLPYDYAMSKFLGSKTHLDTKSSVQAMRECICSYRRDGSYTAEQAREMWSAVTAAQKGYREEFSDCIASGAFGKYRQDWYEWLRYSHGPQARHFWNLIWRPLMLHLTTKAS